MKTPLIEKMMQMIQGKICIPQQVKNIFVAREDEKAAKVFFPLLEDSFLCPYILCPYLEPKALVSEITSLTNSKEMREYVESIAVAYLEYFKEKYSSNTLKRFCTMEEQLLLNNDDAFEAEVYNQTIEWLEQHLNHEVMFDYADEIYDLIMIIFFCKSEIMLKEEFQDLFFEKRIDLIAIMQQ